MNNQPNKITLTVVTLSGTHEDEYNIHQKLEHVKDVTLRALGITPAPNEVWELTYNNVVLDLNATIEAAMLPDHARLSLAPREGGGGSWTSK
jgi:hypothetical protein